MEDFPPLLVKTDPKSVRHSVDLEGRIVICHNIPPHITLSQFERHLQSELAPGMPSGKLSIAQILPPATFENPLDQPWRLLCGDKDTAAYLIQRAVFELIVEKESFLTKADEDKTTVTVYFEEGGAFEIPHPLFGPIMPINHCQSAAGGRPVKQRATTPRLPGSIGDLMKEYVSSRKLKTANCCSPSTAGNLLHSSRSRQQCRDGASCGNANVFRDRNWSAVSEFPPDVPIQRVPDFVKEKFCIVCRNKPDAWKARDLEEFLTDYLREKGVLTKIASIFSTASRPRMATIACKDELSRREMLRHPRIPLQSECSSNSSAPCLELHPFVRRPQMSTIRSDAAQCIGQYERLGSALSASGSSTKTSASAAPSELVFHDALDLADASVQLRLSMLVQNKPLSWSHSELIDFLNSHFQSTMNEKLRLTGSHAGVSFAYPCSNSTVAWVYCSSESIRDAFVAERTVRLPSSTDNSGRLVTQEFLELVPCGEASVNNWTEPLRL